MAHFPNDKDKITVDCRTGQETVLFPLQNTIQRNKVLYFLKAVSHVSKPEGV